MLSLTTAQLDAWLATLIFPGMRLLGLATTAPVFSGRGVPIPIRLGLGLALALALAPILPPAPSGSTTGWLGLAALLREAAIGAAMGFTLRLVFAAIDLAGELMGLSMGLSFASFYEPLIAVDSPFPARFLAILASLVFLELDGHLMIIAAVAKSFEWLPVAGAPALPAGWAFVAHHGLTIFSAGLMLALPLMAALLVTHLALSLLGRAAPQLHLFAVGFPVTQCIGLVILLLALQAYGPALRNLSEQGLEAVGQLLRTLASG